MKLGLPCKGQRRSQLQCRHQPLLHLQHRGAASAIGANAVRLAGAPAVDVERPEVQGHHGGWLQLRDVKVHVNSMGYREYRSPDLPGRGRFVEDRLDGTPRGEISTSQCFQWRHRVWVFRNSQGGWTQPHRYWWCHEETMRWFWTPGPGQRLQSREAWDFDGTDYWRTRVNSWGEEEYDRFACEDVE